MKRTTIVASLMALMLGAGPAFAQATPPVSPAPTQPGAAKMDKQMSKKTTATKKKAMKKTKQSDQMSR
jgi:hypothetical protein